MPGRRSPRLGRTFGALAVLASPALRLPSWHAAAAGPALSRLSSLRDYRVELTIGRYHQTYRVHAPDDWELLGTGGQPESIDVAGSEYARVPVISGGHVTVHWQRLGVAQPYAHTPYPGYVATFVGLTHVRGVRLAAAGTCRQDGLGGHRWRFVPAARGAAAPRVTVCVADGSGALLRYDQGTAPGIPTPGAVMAITGIGDVPAIPVPHGTTP